jgi:hypothetical protein
MTNLRRGNSRPHRLSEESGMRRPEWIEHWVYSALAPAPANSPRLLLAPPGNWRQAAAIAVRLIREAQASGISGEQIGEYVMDAVRDDNLGAREKTAILLLVGASAGIQLNDEPGDRWYIDGQHRYAAQLDQGVRETIIQRLELLDPATGQPLPD